MNVLVINCGSSSLKYQLIDSKNESVLAKGIVERIGIEGSKLKHSPEGKDSVVIETPMENHKIAVSLVIKALMDTNHGVIESMDEINAVGHRVVHGGEKFKSSTLIDEEVLKAIEDCNDLAPLHNPANLIGIRACQELMPTTPMVAVFDTAFHQTMPEVSYLYGLPYEYYEKYKVRRYGFHGTSHMFVSNRTGEFLGKDSNDLKIIVCHLGNGASITAVDHGKSIDTTMGLTPLEGLVMGTRSGSIDPAIIEFIAEKDNITLPEVINILNKKSGILGISDISSDFRDLQAKKLEGNKRAEIAIDVFCYNVVKYIGAFAAVMNGVDAIVFTAGVGENDYLVREQVCANLGYLGFELDKEKNNVRGEEVEITTPSSKVKGLVVPTNEELAIARETVSLI